MRLYCVIGYPIKHSLSPKIHNRAFRLRKIPARYEAVEVKPQNLANFMRTFRGKYIGGNVTIPHKEKIIRFLDKLSPEARAIGAVNTIVNRNGKLVGYNTDVYGAIEALKSRIMVRAPHHDTRFLKNKKVIVLGAGGAARAIVYGLKKAGARVTILNRTLAHAKKLARDFGCNSVSLRAKRSNLDCDILINATSVGMWPKSRATPLPHLKEFLHGLKKKPIVMDIVYRPRMTKLLHDAKKAGCKIITGDRMFFAQAKKAFELWN